MAAKKPNWTKLETTIGTAEQVPALLAALSSPSKAKRKEALSELAPLLVEDGNRSEAAIFVIPELAGRLGRANGEDRLALMELLSWLAVSRPADAFPAHLTPVGQGGGDQPAGDTNARAYLAVEAHAREISELLADRDPAVRGAALGVLCNTPPRAGELLWPALSERFPPWRVWPPSPS
jgi:HEAT repeat protein